MAKIFNAIGQFIHQHAIEVMTVVLALTVAVGFGMTKIQMTMGNDMFISTKSKLYKDSQKYSKHFGGDSFVVLIKPNSGNAVNAKTFQKVIKFEKNVKKIANVKEATSIVDVINQQMTSGSATSISAGANSSALQKRLMSELSASDQKQLSADLQTMLTSQQKQRLLTYVTTILTAEQKQQMATAQAQLTALPQAQQQAAVAKMQSQLMSQLDATQQAKVQAYSMSLLDTGQVSKLSNDLMGMLPAVQNMKTATIHALLYSDNGKLPSAMKQLLPKNGQYILVSIPTTAKASMSEYQSINTKLKRTLKDSGLKSSAYSVSIGGNPAIQGSIAPVMMHAMAIMLSASVILMIVILLVVFPVRRRVLPLAATLVGIVWTFGLMGWLGLKLSMATMATLPILMGLGTDFGVQFLNRYEEEFRQEPDPAEATRRAAKYTGPAVATAVVVMIFSFLTMHLSKAPMMQGFGTTLAIGVTVCFVVELALVFAYLALADRKSVKQIVTVKTFKPSRLSQILRRYSRWVMKHALILVIIGAVAGVAGFFFEGKLGVETDMQKMIPQDMPALVANKKLVKEVGSQTKLTYMIEAKDVRDKKVVNYLRSFGQAEQAKYGKGKIESITSLATTLDDMNVHSGTQKALNQEISTLPKAMRSQLLTSDHRAASITVTLNKHLSSADGLKLMNRITKDAKDHPAGVRIAVAGGQAELLQGISNMTANHGLIIIAGLAIIFIVLLLVYHKVKDAIYPILPIAIVLGLSPLTLYALGISYNPVTVALSSLVLGIGTEFTILVLERYSEERRRGMDVPVAIENAIGSVGQAITVSGLTVMGGFSTLMFGGFPVLQSFGLITVLDTGYSLLMTLTIMPAVIYLFRKRK